MNLLETFDIAIGTTAGRRHRTGVNLASNQDAVRYTASGELIVGVLADGCGSQPYSEFGSRLMVELLTKLIRRHHAAGRAFDDAGFAMIYTALVQRLKTAASVLLDGSTVEALNAHLMATAGGVIITSETTTFFGAGDFVFLVNGVGHLWEPEEGNKPLYPALALAFPGDARFFFRTLSLPTAEVTNFVFATDGGVELMKVCKAEDELVPGTDDRAGPIDKIWSTDEFYTNTEALGAWLNSLAQNWRMPGPPHHGGLLEDDTTLVVGRRKEANSA